MLILALLSSPTLYDTRGGLNYKFNYVFYLTEVTFHVFIYILKRMYFSSIPDWLAATLLADV